MTYVYRCIVSMFYLCMLMPVMAWADIHASPLGFTEVSSLRSGTELNSQVYYAKDPESDWNPNSSIPLEWHSADKISLSFGYTDAAYWFQLNLVHTGFEPIARLLGLSYPVLDHVTVYQRLNGGEWTSLELGDKQPFAERPVLHRFFVLPVSLNPEDKLEILYRVKTSSSMQFPLHIWQERDFFVNDQAQILGMGVYYGIMIIMVLYNLFVFFSVREANYLYYVLYVGCMALFLSSMQGINFQYLWPQATKWNDQSILVFLGGVVAFALIFTRNFLNLKEFKRHNQLYGWMSFVVCLMVLASFVLPYHVMIRALITMAMIGIALASASSIIRWRQGYLPARYYAIAWSSVLLGGIILALNKFDVIPRNFFTEYAVQLGSALEVILLSFALADRLNQEKRVRYDAQLMALQHERHARKLQDEALEQERNARLAQEKALEHERAAREAQARALEIQRQATETLEERVRERTLELEEANHQLELMSITDSLTNVRNRRYFDQVAQREMARAIRSREFIAFLMIDIDYFKKINDTYGHQAGDDVLRIVAQTIRQHLQRSNDLLARYGGEEFVLVLSGGNIEGVLQIAENIRRSIEALDLDRVAEGIRVTVSIGVHGAVPNYVNTHEDWLRFADEALYVAKGSGRNQVQRHEVIDDVYAGAMTFL